MPSTSTQYRCWLFVALMMVALVEAANAPNDIQPLGCGDLSPRSKAATSRRTPQQEPRGLVIDEVAADSAAAKAGLKAGDRVLGYNGKSLPSPAALLAAEENTFGKQEVALIIRRGEEMLTLTAPLGKLGIQVRPDLPLTALTLYDEGRAAQKAQKTEEFITKWTAAAKAAQEAEDTTAAAWLYSRVGEIHESQRKWKEASEAHVAAWELLEQSSDRAAQSRTLLALGRCSQNLNDFPAAARWYEQAEQVDAAAGNEMWVAGDANNLGIVAEKRGDLAAAQDYYRRALVIQERLSPHSLEMAASLNNLGNVARSRSDLASAQEYHSRALAIRERLAPNSLVMAASLNNLGAIAYSRSDLAAAQDYFSRALALREQLAPNSLDVANSFNNLGIVAFARGDLAGAQGYYSRALAIQERESPNSLDVAASLANLGFVARSRGDLAAAQDYYRRALTLRERLAPNSLVVATNLIGLGIVAWSRGDLAGAQDYYSRALAIQEREAPHSRAVAASLNNLGLVARARGELAAAQDYHSRALTIQERLMPNSLDLAANLNNLGNVAQARGELAAAQDYHSRALAIKERLAANSLTVAASLNSLGNVARARGELAVAWDYHSRALAIQERLAPTSLDVASILNNLGKVALKQRRFSDALPLFSRAIAIVEDQRWQIRSPEARALLLAQQTEPYAGMLRAHLALNDLPSAFAAAERARARSLLEFLTEARAEIRQGVDATLLERERLLQQQLNATADRQTRLLSSRHTDEQAATVKKELDTLLVQYNEVQAQIRATSPRYAALVQPQPLGLKEIQEQVLDENTLLLEYVLGEESSHLLAVTPTSIKSYELPKRAEIEQAARRVYELLTARQPMRGETLGERQARIAKADADSPAAAAALSQMVLGPVAAELSRQRLLIVADGALQYVPFAALPRPVKSEELKVKNEELTGQTTNNFSLLTLHSPLILDHEIVSLPSASVVAVLRRELQGRKPAEKLVAVLADPVFDSEDPRLKLARQAPQTQIAKASLPAEVERAARSAGLVNDRGSLSRLPFTREEADAILSVAPAGQSTKALDFNANRATAMSPELSRYRIVHLATHGVVNTEHPELSGLVLSLVDEEGRPQVGFLRLHEVYNLNLPAELVVLSACQTGLGKEIKGEGLVGLTRGFMYAGAKRVLASLWNVNDSVTAQLMRRLYQGLLVKGMPPAAALRAAQVEMWKRKQWRSPYYWAAFVLQGEWR
jgi:CHAT domain-containing protein